MKGTHPGPLASALVLAAVFTAASGYAARKPPQPLPMSAPDTAFSAERAMRHVRAIAERPHPIGSPDHNRVRDYLLDQLKALGLEPQVQKTTAVGTRFPVAGNVENVLARLPGTGPGDEAVMLTAHYDGMAASPGASDDASGCSVLLEVLRALKTSDPLVHDVIVLFTDGEEAGLLGAAAFVREHPWARDVEVTLNFEARGTGGRAGMFQTGSGNLDQVRVLRRQPNASATSFAVTVYEFLPNDTDLSELFDLAKPGLNFAFADGVERYHTSEDDSAHIDPGSIQHEGAVALGMTRSFGNGALPLPKTEQAIFFDVPLFGVVVYPESWAKPLAVLLLAITLIAILQVARREPRWWLGIVLGLIGLVVVVAIGGGTAFAFTRGAPAGLAAPAVRGLVATGLALFALGVSLFFWAVIRCWVGAPGAATGPLIVWTALAVAATWKLPGVSFAVVWPAFAAAFAAAVGTESGRSWIAGIARWAPACVVALILVPLLYETCVVALGITGLGATAMGVFVPLVAWLLAPDLEAIGRHHRWRAAFVTIGIGLAVVVTSRTLGSRVTFPSRSMVVYAHNADAVDGWLVTAASFAHAGGWNAAALGAPADLVDGDAPGTPTSPPSWLQLVGGRGEHSFPVVAAPASRIDIVPPAVTVIRDESIGEERHLTMRVTAGTTTNSVYLNVTGATVIAAEIDGREVDRGRYRLQPPDWELTYWGPPRDGFTLSLVVRKDDRPILQLLSRTSGLPASVELPPRPPHVLASQGGDMTVIYRRVAFETAPSGGCSANVGRAASD